MPKNTPYQLTPDEVAWLRALPMSKRAALVRDHILEHGSITTGQLAELGYGHPPRAAADLRDAGAGVDTVMVRDAAGRRMASYVFNGKPNLNGAGRVVIPKEFSDRLKAEAGFRCGVCSGEFEGRELQADHRVPFHIGGDKPTFEIRDFMPLCASDNRSKSWTCEHCPNWDEKNVDMCLSCFWCSPEQYDHIAGREQRQLNLTFQGAAVGVYDRLQAAAAETGHTVTEYIRDIILDNDVI